MTAPQPPSLVPFALVAALAFVHACRTTGGVGGDNLGADLIDRPSLSRTKQVPLDAIADARQRAFAERMLTFLREHAAREPQSGHEPVGEPVTSVIDVETDADGRVMGGAASLFQPAAGGGGWNVEARFGADGKPVTPLAPMRFHEDAAVP